ncbi:n-acetyltransferase ats1 [Fusarium albosuccineum]|uniref:N-acetyltransferase ats1 n=1 Tax=Fusarium albosuccineum TaxID=1237068 RepID=A0A8H4LL13_9HYPO|nr:n-acetyltransferase ats1 [Fusarium albosuccineum]
MTLQKGHIRHARRSDVPIILVFTKELADYQNELSSVTATEDLLHQSIAFDPEENDNAAGVKGTDLISAHRPARCLLAINELGAPVGMAIYFCCYVSWRAAPGIYLEDLYVQPSERRNGWGKRLFDALGEELRAIGGARMEWRVLEWNKAGIRFYESMGATVMEGWKDMKLEGADITFSKANSTP